MATTIPTQLDKCKGAMVATAIGDALGWPNEQRAKNTKKKVVASDSFVEWSRRCKKPCWHTEKILPGEYSDDTQLTLSVARSIIAGNWEEQFSRKELPFWLTYERGGGRALLQAAKCYKEGYYPWQSKYSSEYYNAGGNGAVMRILPHIIASTEIADLNELMSLVIKNCILTHGHPRAILGTTCYAFALNYLLKKETILEYGELVDALIDAQLVWGAFPNSISIFHWLNYAESNAPYAYRDIWEQSVAHMVEQLLHIKASLKKGLILDDQKVLTQLECFGSVNGAGDVAILAAVYLASKYANNPQLGIRVPACSSGADTDTIASITGGLLGMLCGTSWIPDHWKKVQDYECIVRMTELLLSSSKKEDSKALVSEVRNTSDQWENSPIGWIKKVNVLEYEASKERLISISRYQSALGQTFYSKDYQVIPQNEQMQMPLYSGNLSKNTFSEPPFNGTGVTTGKQKEFILTASEIDILLKNPSLKNKTFGKILSALHSLALGKDTCDSLAKKLRIDREIIDLLSKHFK